LNIQVKDWKMPALTVDDPTVLPRIVPTLPQRATSREPRQVLTAHEQLEGAGIAIHRAFPGHLSLVDADPFLMLDHMGPYLNGPAEAKGAPWHPHRGFETVTYVLDGEISHNDSNGGGGVIGEGDTQWMTAGAGILHDELPTERFYKTGGPSHGVQLWVNLPRRRKMTAPRYQSILGGDLRLLTSQDGTALIRLIAGEIGGFSGPGVTHTPITYVHATVPVDGLVAIPWNPRFNALVYVLTGDGFVGSHEQPIRAHQLAQLGPGGSIQLRAAKRMADGTGALDVLVMGGLPLREPIASYGPFVMNTQAEIVTAIEDFDSGRLGRIPADQTAPRHFS
jgi:redox-sensitive bicupin YhaK (pirin superfamily)